MTRAEALETVARLDRKQRLSYEEILLWAEAKALLMTPQELRVLREGIAL